MKEIIKSVKELQGIVDEDPGNTYQIKKGIEGIIEALVNKTVDEFTWRGKYMKREDIPEEKKEYCDRNMSFLYMHMKPFEKQMREMYPEFKEAFDKRAVKVEELKATFKPKTNYNKGW